MFDVDKGFRLGERLFPWGTRPEEVAAAHGIPFDVPSGRSYRCLTIPCTPTYGFDTFTAELAADGPDRPVTALTYEIAARAGDKLPDPERWAGELSTTFGQPREAYFRELPDHPDTSTSVRYYAKWPLAEHSVGLGAYGGLRKVKHGLSSGCLWLTWAILSAAKPFLSEWRARAAELESLAAAHSGTVTFTLITPQQSADNEIGDSVEARALRDACFALREPEIMPTPSVIATRLGSDSIAFWRSGDHTRWCASTRSRSILFRIGEPVTVDWYDVLPAKGGGYSEIRIGRWGIRDAADSRPVKNAVEALARIPGVTVKYAQGHDC